MNHVARVARLNLSFYTASATFSHFALVSEPERNWAKPLHIITAAGLARVSGACFQRPSTYDNVLYRM
jgi:hypothetical protein